ncbi:MAG: preprotein translocase subunit SecA [candidate division SR1 bacterium]|nr:preprotein translocase subunit SecA [candidate division SR1 bacterium]
MKFIVGDYNQKQLNKYLPLIKKINDYSSQFDAFSDDQIKAKTQDFKERLAKGESLDDILPEAFATVKQACKRMVGAQVEVKGEMLTWNMVPYDMQLLGGIILHKGIIAEMKTGEGKTLVAVMPVYLNALAGKGVHVVTVNDYLASRDAQWMGHVYARLGLTSGCVTKTVPLQKRREEYSKDITYIENSELGFDYLRDNLVKSMKERSLLRRPLNYAIVDEIDSILIDEARTPLIISEPNAEATEKYLYYAQISRGLTPCSSKKKVSKGLLQELLTDAKSGKDQEDDGDYYIDEKTKTAALSGKGITKLEGILKVENLYKDLGYEEIHHIENALRAQAVYEKDKEYIVKDNEVLIVDEHTGRTMPGRRFSEGLHQAIEAKEGVKIQKESKTLATITYQNFFKQYVKLGGMTGTALTEGEEFEKIYDLSVLEIPTNRPTIRVDRNDKVYYNEAIKWKFVKQHIKFAHDIGQPILIGTANIATSEYVSRTLEKDAITHYVLNAKFHEQEAHIVSQAGKYKSVVVATNMAGRGTDIKLESGLNDKLADNYAKWIKKQILSDKKGISVDIYSQIEYELTMEGMKREFGISDELIRQAEQDRVSHQGIMMKVKFNRSKKVNTDAFAELLCKPADFASTETIEQDFHYGLFILGTEKHESRRIDNQLRGRAGRQGDPGVSVFFVALDDLIMRKMGGERIQGVASMLLGAADLENLELSQKQFSNSIVRSQKQMEGRHFGTRKHLFDYDSVINKQRQAIYKKRDDILASETDEKLRAYLVELIKLEIEANMSDIVRQQIANAKVLDQSVAQFLRVMDKEFSLKLDHKQFQMFEEMTFEKLQPDLSLFMLDQLKAKFAMMDTNRLYQIFKDVYLYHLDKLRVKHLDDMEYLRDKVGLVGYAQLDPLVIYKSEAFEKFQTLLYRLKFDVTAYIAGIDFTSVQQQDAQQVVMASSQSEAEYLKMLQQVSSEVKEIKFDSSGGTKDKPRAKEPEKMVYENSDGVEIFEVNDKNQPMGTPNVFDEAVIPQPGGKVRPNDPCPCGSGKKYKKCCGAK